MPNPESPLSKPQIDLFARGLYHLARVDGVDPREIEIIHAFLDDAGCPELVESLETAPFDLDEARAAFDAPLVRQIFIQAAIVLVRADGELSDAERRAITEVADALELADALDALEAEVADVTSFE